MSTKAKKTPWARRRSSTASMRHAPDKKKKDALGTRPPRTGQTIRGSNRSDRCSNPLPSCRRPCVQSTGSASPAGTPGASTQSPGSAGTTPFCGRARARAQTRRKGTKDRAPTPTHDECLGEVLETENAPERPAFQGMGPRSRSCDRSGGRSPKCLMCTCLLMSFGALNSTPKCPKLCPDPINHQPRQVAHVSTRQGTFCVYTWPVLSWSQTKNKQASELVDIRCPAPPKN